MNPLNLEPEALALIRATARGPFLFQLGPEKGRHELERIQKVPSPLPLPEAELEEKMVPLKGGGFVSVRIYRPRQAPALLPVILYAHGAGWVFGNAHTHDRLVRELASLCQAALVFVNYSLSPEAKYPVALEEVYAVALWLSQEGAMQGLDPNRLAIAGDSVGGNLASSVTLMAKARGGPAITQQLLFYPVCDASFDTPSYREFATGYYLRRDAMQWFWGQYLRGPQDGQQIGASPLRASLEQLAGLPPALVITAEADVLRDEGEAYADKLRQAGVRVTSVRFRGMVHDFMMLNALAGTASARGALGLASDWLRKSWGEHKQPEGLLAASQA